jgi:hypothetical protein
MAKLFWLKYVSFLLDITIVHFLFNILKLSLRQVIEDKVIFETVND